MTAKLKRSLNLPLVVFYGTGTILGAGIYALIGKVSGAAGILAPFSFLVSAALAGLTAYSYSQLVKRYPKSAGEAEYVYQGFRSKSLSNLVGWLVALTGVVSSGVLVTALVGYFQVFWPAISDQWIMLLFIFLFSALAIVGIEESAWAVTLITLVEILGLILVCSAGFEDAASKGFLIHEIKAQWTLTNLAPVLTGAFIAFYAFIGFEDMVNLAEETKQPTRTMPIAIFIALAVSTVLYLFVAFIAISALPPDELQASTAPISDMYIAHGGNKLIISGIALLAIANGVLAQIIMASRVLFGLRHPFQFLKPLSYVWPKTQTPVISILFVSLIITFLSLSYSIETLASLTSFIILIIFSLVNIALILIEWQSPKGKVLNYLIPSLAVILNLSFMAYRVM